MNKDRLIWLGYRLAALGAFVVGYLLLRPRAVAWGGDYAATLLDLAAPIALGLPAWVYLLVRPRDHLTMRLTGMVIAGFGGVRLFGLIGQARDLETLGSADIPSVGVTLMTLIVGLVIFGRAGRDQASLQEKGEWKRSRRDTFGSAQLAERKHVEKLLGTTSGIPLAQWGPREEIMRWEAQGPLLTLAPSNAGKGISTVGPCCAEYDGGMVILDPKGQNYAIWAIGRRMRGHRVVLLNPFDVPAAKGATAYWNPLDHIVEGPGFQQAVGAITDCLVVADPGENVHFYETAKVMIAGVIAYIAATKRGNERTLGAVYDHFLLLRRKEFDAWSRAMIGRTDLGGGLVALAGKLWDEVEDKEKGSMFSTVTRHISFLSDPQMRDAVSRSSFDLRDLVTGKLDIFVALPANTPEPNRRFYRLVVGLAIDTIVKAKAKPKRDILMLLDEASVLGRMNCLLNPNTGAGALTWGRDFGIKLWMILQSPEQLVGAYGESGAKIWMGQMAVTQIFGVSKTDQDTSKKIAELIGETTIETTGESRGSGESIRGFEVVGGASTSLNVSMQDQRRLVITADELRRLGEDEVILLMRDVEYPIRTQRIKYYKRREYAFRYGVNPFYKLDDQPYALIEGPPAASQNVLAPAAP